VGTHLIKRAVETRMAVSGVESLAGYIDLLDNSGAELQALIEEVVVPESWFFRDSRPFVVLCQHARARRACDPSLPPLRVLSLPCAGGEEPYSIAMALIDTGLPSAQFHIDAVDISDRALARARRGVYSLNAFRGPYSSFRTRYFHQGPEGYALDVAVKGTVRFLRGNLIDPGLLADRPPYDVVFCRNLLIYLDRDARERAVAALDRLLAPSGLVFIGHAETLSFPSSPFVMADESGSFAYRRASPDATAATLRRRESSRPKPPPSRPPARPLSATIPPALPGPAPVRALTAPIAPQVSSTPLERASDLANQRRFDEAIRLCQQSIHEDGPTAQAYFLLGIIQQAAGKEPQAETCFHKAVYLDGQHDEALLALALIARRRGDHPSAAGYHRRATRALQNKGTR
jgi:chemotaxis protein methyltransferase WspC